MFFSHTGLSVSGRRKNLSFEDVTSSSAMLQSLLSIGGLSNDSPPIFFIGWYIGHMMFVRRANFNNQFTPICVTLLCFSFHERAHLCSNSVRTSFLFCISPITVSQYTHAELLTKYQKDHRGIHPSYPTDL